MNRAQLRVAVLQRLGVVAPAGDPKLDPAAVHGAIDLALQSISADRQLDWLLTVTSGTVATGTGQMALPADCIDIKKMTVLQTDGSYLEARQAPFDDVVPAVPGSDSSWTRFGNLVQVTPIPTSALTVRLYYWRTEPPLAADDQTPLLPAQFHQAIVLHAARDLAIRKSDGKLINVLTGLANAELDKIKRRPGTTGRRVVREVAYGPEDLVQYAVWS